MATRMEHTRTCSAGWDFDADCTCGLQQRIEGQTWKTMYEAWRKRAEEAETREAAHEAKVRALEELLAERDTEMAEWKAVAGEYRESHVMDCDCLPCLDYRDAISGANRIDDALLNPSTKKGEREP